MSGVLELRIHGVSGTPPSSMLGVGRTQVDPPEGDIGFYRPAAGVQPSGVPLRPGLRVEAYAWGALTSGVRGAFGWLQRALWLSLLPFALVNVAMWARPGLHDPQNGRGRWVAAVLIRWAGLLLTAFFVVMAAGIGVDLVAWQCFRDGVPSCPVLPDWLGFLGSAPFAEPGRRLAVGQALPVAALGLLWGLARTTVQRYEAYPAGPAEATSPHLLGRRAMWEGGGRVTRLANLHLAAGLCVVVLVTAAPMLRADRRLFAGTALAAAVLAVAVLVVTAVLVRDQVEYPPPGPGARRWLRPAPLFGLAALLLVVHTVLLVVDGDTDGAQADDMLGSGAAPGWLALALFAAAGALVGISRRPWTAVLAVVPVLAGIAVVRFVDGAQFVWLVAVIGVIVGAGAALHIGSRRQEQAWGGSAPGLLVGAAVLVAVLFTTALTLLAGNWLNGGASVSDLGRESSGPPARGAFRVGDDAVLTRGVLDLTGPAAVLRRGQIGSAALESGAGSVTRGAASSLLSPGDTVDLTGASLSLSDVCLLGPGGPEQVGRGTIRLPPGAAGDDVRLTVGSDIGTPSGCEGDPAAAAVVSTSTAAPLRVAAPYVWFAAVLPVVLVLGGGLVGVLYAVLRRRRAAVAGLLDADITFLSSEPDTTSAEELERSRALALRRRLAAAFAHRAEAAVSFLSAPVIAGSVVVAAGLAADARPWEVGAGVTWLRWTADAGLWVTVGVGLLIIGLGARLRSSAGLRRRVGVLWDLSTFWPRAAHPFGPPCYAERVVPEVSERILSALEGGDTVVVSAHSQGSTIGVAALFQVYGGLDPGAEGAEAWSRVRLLTYGSQLRSWFGRIFPDVLGPGVLGHEPTTRTSFRSARPDVPGPGVPAGGWTGPGTGTLTALLGLGAWRSLFRRTDPLGFRVYRDTDDPAADPVDHWVPEVQPRYGPGGAAPLSTHSGYQGTERYRRVVEGWVAPVLGPPPGKEAPAGVLEWLRAWLGR